MLTLKIHPPELNNEGPILENEEATLGTLWSLVEKGYLALNSINVLDVGKRRYKSWFPQV